MAGRWTNYPNGITSLGIPTFGAGGLLPFVGNYWFVQEVTTAGVAAGEGSAKSPFNTLQQAINAATPGNNDVIFLTGTVHQSAGQGSILWNKNNTHLVGLCAPVRRGKRARISVTGSTGFNQLVKVTGTGCQFLNFGTFYGFPNTSGALVCWEDDGGENFYGNCELLGFGDGTASTGTAALAGARSLKMNSNTGQNTFRSCVFGVDTEPRTAANYNIEIAGGSPRNTFEDCDLEAYIGSGGTGGGFLLVGAAGIDRYLNFRDCRFGNAFLSSASTLTQAMNLSGSAGGVVNLQGLTTGWGFTHWETSQSGSLYGSVPLPVAANMGLELEVAT